MSILPGSPPGRPQPCRHLLPPPHRAQQRRAHRLRTRHVLHQVVDKQAARRVGVLQARKRDLGGHLHEAALVAAQLCQRHVLREAQPAHGAARADAHQACRPARRRVLRGRHRVHHLLHRAVNVVQRVGGGQCGVGGGGGGLERLGHHGGGVGGRGPLPALFPCHRRHDGGHLGRSLLGVACGPDREQRRVPAVARVRPLKPPSQVSKHVIAVLVALPRAVPRRARVCRCVHVHHAVLGTGRARNAPQLVAVALDVVKRVQQRDGRLGG
mmetsp:Transcript_34556/g.87383  ORF Transcript_34556/g.87383 Transcript_34556/m.87383 type:complete len:269 (-) Transcript_34556:219-1025(-)